MIRENISITPPREKLDGVSVANSHLNEQLIKITGILNSRIEVKPSTDIPAYGFFRLDDYQQDIPVIFRIKEKSTSAFNKHGENNNWIKPVISKGSICELVGYFTDTAKERPSFTCYSYQLLSEPKPLTSQELQTLIQGLLSTTLEKYKEWTNRKDFLFKKLEELKEIETLSKLGENFLTAYLTLKQAQYANYQEKHLNSNFDLAHYLSNISQEIHLVKSHIEAYARKELSHE